jgi:hypothetical protein
MVGFGRKYINTSSKSRIEWWDTSFMKFEEWKPQNWCGFSEFHIVSG